MQSNVSIRSVHLLGSLLLTTGSIAACGSVPDDPEQQESALTQNNHPTELYVVAYFGDDGNWNTLLNMLGSGGHPTARIIVTGTNNGPDTPVNQTLKNHIDALHARGVKAIGYVNYATSYVYTSRMKPDVSLSPSAVAGQVRTWMNDYNADGIFFDQSWRRGPDINDQRLADAEGLVKLSLSLAASRSANRLPPWDVFNWGFPDPEMRRYVDCLTRNMRIPLGPIYVNNVIFVSQETTQGEFTASDPTPSWLLGYPPEKFMNIVNLASPSMFSSLTDTMRTQRNASGFFVTDQSTSSYMVPPAMALLQSNVSHDNLQYADYAGADSGNYTATMCPTPTSF